MDGRGRDRKKKGRGASRLMPKKDLKKDGSKLTGREKPNPAPASFIVPQISRDDKKKKKEKKKKKKSQAGQRIRKGLHAHGLTRQQRRSDERS